MNTPQPTSNEQHQSLDTVDFMGDFGEAKHTVTINRIFKVHILIAVIATSASFVVWLLVDLFAQHWPWFIYPATLFGLSISFHFYMLVRPKEVLSLHFAWYFVFNLCIFMSWLFSGSSKPWFLFVILGWGILLVTHYILVSYRDNPNRNLYLHLSVYSLINALCFFIWLIFPGMAWFVWPFFGLGLPAVVHWSLFYHPSNWYRLHLLVFIDVQLLLFFSWVVTGMPFPWWIIPLILWSLLLVLHAYKTQGVTNKPTVGEAYQPPPEGPFGFEQDSKATLYPQTSLGTEQTQPYTQL